MPLAGHVRNTSEPRLRVAWLCLREVRPAVQGIVLLRFAVAVTLTAEQPASPRGCWFVAALAVGCATAFNYLLNGLTDITEDRLNGSRRPLATGELQPEVAYRALWALAFAALCAAALGGPALFAVTVAMVTLGWLYSAHAAPAKASAPRGMSVLLLSGVLTYTAGYLAVPDGERVSRSTPLLIVATVMSLWMVVGALTKDLSDVRGDAFVGRRSWPVLLGNAGTRYAIVAVAETLALALLLATLHISSGLGAVALVVAIGAMVVGVTALAPPWRGSLRLPYRSFMVTQYCSHLTLLVL